MQEGQQGKLIADCALEQEVFILDSAAYAPLSGANPEATSAKNARVGPFKLATNGAAIIQPDADPLPENWRADDGACYPAIDSTQASDAAVQEIMDSGMNCALTAVMTNCAASTHFAPCAIGMQEVGLASYPTPFDVLCLSTAGADVPIYSEDVYDAYPTFNSPPVHQEAGAAAQQQKQVPTKITTTFNQALLVASVINGEGHRETYTDPNTKETLNVTLYPLLTDTDQSEVMQEAIAKAPPMLLCLDERRKPNASAGPVHIPIALDPDAFDPTALGDSAFNDAYRPLFPDCFDDNAEPTGVYDAFLAKFHTSVYHRMSWFCIFKLAVEIARVVPKHLRNFMSMDFHISISMGHMWIVTSKPFFSHQWVTLFVERSLRDCPGFTVTASGTDIRVARAVLHMETSEGFALSSLWNSRANTTLGNMFTADNYISNPSDKRLCAAHIFFDAVAVAPFAVMRGLLSQDSRRPLSKQEQLVHAAYQFTAEENHRRIFNFTQLSQSIASQQKKRVLKVEWDIQFSSAPTKKEKANGANRMSLIATSRMDRPYIELSVTKPAVTVSSTSSKQNKKAMHTNMDNALTDVYFLRLCAAIVDMASEDAIYAEFASVARTLFVYDLPKGASNPTAAA